MLLHRFLLAYSISDCQQIVDRRNRLRWIKDEEVREQYRSTFMQQDRLAFRLTCEKVTEFFA